MDGWGLRAERTANAVALARTPSYDALMAEWPHATLGAAEEAVGLPAGQMGNSEVGHMNLGAGRVVYQDITRIDQAITSGEFFENPAIGGALDAARRAGRTVHLLGLLSDGGVHSHQRHCHALVGMARRRGIERLAVHVFTDGRDTSPTGGIGYVAQLQAVLDHHKIGRIADVMGRYYAMDRDKRWDRTERAYRALTRGEGVPGADPRRLIEASYARGATDEFIEPAVVTGSDGAPVAPIRDGDAVIFYNFRADRARQITRALALESVDGFGRPSLSLNFVCMTEYDATFTLPVAFPPQSFRGNLAEVLTAANLTNLRIAETEKYAHVTYFYNCGEETPYAGEDRVLVPSPKVATYDLKPEMSAAGITERLVADLDARAHDVVVCNFANADMVGHSGILEAAIKAVEAVDTSLAKIVAAVRRAGGTLLVTADHGNAELMVDPVTGGPHTAHTTNPVPFILLNRGNRIPLREGGALRDVAPTMLGLLELDPPGGMTGTDLRRR